MDKSVSIKVLGLSDLRRAFKEVDAQLPLAMKAELLKIATDVAGKIQSKVPYRTGRARASVKASSSTGGASIAVGGTAAPYYPWLDFGGSVGPNESVKRAFIKEGRYLYPTIREENQNIKNAVDEAVVRVTEEADFITGGGIGG